MVIRLMVITWSMAAARSGQLVSPLTAPIIVSLLSVANAGRHCEFPDTKWFAYDELLGRSTGYSVGAMNGKAYSAGYMKGSFGLFGSTKDGVVPPSQAHFGDAHAGLWNLFIAEVDVPTAKMERGWYMMAGESPSQSQQAIIWHIKAMLDQKHLAVTGYFTGLLTLPDGTTLWDTANPTRPNKDAVRFVMKLDATTANGIGPGTSGWARKMDEDINGNLRYPGGVTVRTVDGDEDGNMIVVYQGCTGYNATQVSGTDRRGRPILGKAEGCSERLAKLWAVDGSEAWEVEISLAFHQGCRFIKDGNFYCGWAFSSWDILHNISTPGTLDFGNGVTVVSNETTTGIVQFNTHGTAQWAATLVHMVNRLIAFDVSLDGSVLAILGQVGSTSASGQSGPTKLVRIGTSGVQTGSILWEQMLGFSSGTHNFNVAVTDDNKKVYVDGNFMEPAQLSDASGNALTLHTRGSYDALVLTADATDGKVAWATSGGGSGMDYFISPGGCGMAKDSGTHDIIFGGYTRSARLEFGGIARVSPFAAADDAAASSTSANTAGGSNKVFLIALKTTSELPSCLNSCQGASPLQAADVKPGHCFVANQCYNDGEHSPYADFECKICNHTADRLDFTFPTTLSDYCVINGQCVKDGAHQQVRNGFRLADDPCFRCDASSDPTAYTAVEGCVRSNLPPSPPSPPFSPPPSPPPPGTPIGVSDDGYTLKAALANAQLVVGRPVHISVAAGTHELPATVIDASMQASELFIHGAPGAVIRPEEDAGSSRVVLAMADGAPRVHLIGLRFVEGLAIRVVGGELDLDGCIFDGNRTDAQRSHARLSHLLATSVGSVASESLPGRALNVHGGVARVHRCGFVDLEGGAILVTAQGTLKVASSEFRRNRAAAGGAILVEHESSASFVTSLISDCMAHVGGALRASHGAIVVLKHSHILRCTAQDSGGGLSVLDSSVTLVGTLIASCQAQNANGTAQGGGVAASGSTVLLKNATSIVGNHASTSGSAMAVGAGSQVVYQLPAPPGRWIAGTMCAVYRESCPTFEDTSGVSMQDPDCMRTASQCTLKQNAMAVVDGIPCQPTTFAQPCDWTRSPELIGSIVQVLPQSPIEEDYPFDCATGMVGSAESSQQMSALCAGSCPAGYFCPTVRTMEPLLCTKGYFCPTGSSMPTPCSKGTFGKESGLASAAECVACPAGSWCSAGIEVACEVGYYANNLPPEQRISQATCLPCPAFSTTAAQGSAAITECLCNEGFYTSQADGLVRGTGDCVKCPSGTECDTIGLKMQDLPLKTGWWRATNTSVDVKRCNDYNDDTGSGCIGGTNAMACKPSLDGPFCVLCKEEGHFYNRDFNECRECTTTTRYLTIALLLCSCLGLALVSGILMYYCSLPAAKTCKPNRRMLLTVWEAVRSLMVKAKIAWSFYQVATLIPAVYQVQLPAQVEAALEVFRVSIELDAWNVHLSCYSKSGVYSQLAFLMVMPVIGVCFTPLAGLAIALLFKQTTLRELWALGRRRGERSFTEAVLMRFGVPLSLLVLFLAFPPVTSLAFRLFEECTTFSDEVGESQAFLVSSRKHYAIPCPSDELMDARVLAWVAILLYPVGVVVLSAWLLYLGRQTLLLEQESTPYTRSIAFLHASFVPSYFYFDLLELCKKLLLIGFASLIEPGSLVQIMMAVLISLLFLVLHLQSLPYRRNMDNLLATMINLSLVVFFFWTSLLQTGALGEVDDLESGRVSGVGTAVSIMMLVSIVGVVIVAVLLFVFETAAKTSKELAEKRQRAKWAGCTTDPPTTKWPADKSYACFLSHYKMEAASDARLLHDMLAKMLQYPVFLDSANLTDLRQLITNGVADSDVLLVLGTKGIIKRPWCLLEIMQATRLKVPIIIVEITNGGFDVNESQRYLDNLEETMGVDDTSSLELLHEYLGKDLTELKTACTAMLDAAKTGVKLVWNPNASDSELIACLKDICEKMAAAAGGTLHWHGDTARAKERRRGAAREASFARKRRKKQQEASTTALHLICNADEALNEARVIQTEIAMRLDQLVTTSVPTSTDQLVTTSVPTSTDAYPVAKMSILGDNAEAVAVLLTKNVLHAPAALVEVYCAAQQGKDIVPIMIIGRGYDYKGASDLLSNLQAGLAKEAYAELGHALELLSSETGETVGVAGLQAMLAATLPRIIAVNWEPEGGKNQLDATVANVLARLKRAPTSTIVSPALRRAGASTLAVSSRRDRRVAPYALGQLERPEKALEVED